jgi:hypothetical protein
VRIWGHSAEQKKMMHVVLACILFGFMLFFVYVLKSRGRKDAKKLDA